MKKILFLLLVSCAFSSVAQTTFYVTNTSNSGTGSLRQAIINANATEEKDNIFFNIPSQAPHTIIISSDDLDYITHPVVIDGSTQPAYGYTGTAPKIALVPDTLSQYVHTALNFQAHHCELYGLYVHGFSDGNTAVSFVYCDSSVIGDENKPNVFSGNGTPFEVAYSKSVLIHYNKIGTDYTGTTSEPNSWYGIFLYNAAHCVVENNLLSANYDAGVYMLDDTSIVVRANKIGTDISGTYSIPNYRGIYAVLDTDILIGGTQPGDANLVSGNGFGISIGSHVKGCVVYGNLIGTNIDGTDTINGSGAQGISIVSTPESEIYIGGTGVGERNIISGNDEGIGLGSKATIIGNYIGTDITGTVALPNYTGIGFYLADSSVIEHNLISGNSSTGIGGSSNNLVIRHNIIGQDVNGLPLPNQYGINGSPNYSLIDSNLVANSTAEGITLFALFASYPSNGNIFSNNEIFNNGSDGIYLLGNYADQNTFTRNKIYDNGEKGINLGLSSYNCNDSILPPQFLFAGTDSAVGTSAPLTLIELYYNQSFNSNPQGKDFIGTAFADGSGNWTYIGSITDPTNITATATDSAGNTSEFALLPLATSTEDAEAGNSFEIFPNPASSLVRIFFDNNSVQTCNVILVNILGKEIIEQNIRNGETIDVESIPAGIYFIRLYKNGSHWLQKLIVEK